MLTNDIESLTNFAGTFSATVASLVESVVQVDGVDLLLSGGDSILFRIKGDALAAVLEIVKEVVYRSKFTFSGGYASTMQGAYLALKLAKSSGKNRIQGPLTGVES